MLSLHGCLDHSVRLAIGYSTSGFYAPLQYHLFKNAYIVATGYSSVYQCQACAVFWEPKCRMVAFSGPTQNYLHSDVPLIRNNHHVAPNPNLCIPVHGELLNVTIKTTFSTLFVHNLTIDISFSSTRSWCDARPSHQSWMTLRGSRGK